MAWAARPVLFQLKSTNSEASPVQKRDYDRMLSKKIDKVKILLQPRLCTLRSYSSDPFEMIIKSKTDEVSSFFATLSEYIESSNKTQDFEIISGRFAMQPWHLKLQPETVFKKTDVQGIAQAIGVCTGAVAFAACFAWFSSTRGKVGRIFTLNCNTFIDTLIDQIVDGLFYETELKDWTDDI